jgi:pimeloyl-ACP methyl ester carboxylesterase
MRASRHRRSGSGPTGTSTTSHSERGRRGLERAREESCELLWRAWSPTWVGAAFPASAPSLHNPDFVEVVIHSYRHRFGLASGDPRYDRLEELVAGEPPIGVPTVVLEGDADGIGGPSATEDREYFTGPYEHRALPGVGHNAPQEAPEEFADAVLEVLRMSA